MRVWFGNEYRPSGEKVIELDGCKATYRHFVWSSQHEPDFIEVKVTFPYPPSKRHVSALGPLTHPHWMDVGHESAIEGPTSASRSAAVDLMFELARSFGLRAYWPCCFIGDKGRRVLYAVPIPDGLYVKFEALSGSWAWGSVILRSMDDLADFHSLLSKLLELNETVWRTRLEALQACAFLASNPPTIWLGPVSFILQEGADMKTAMEVIDWLAQDFIRG